MTSSRTEYNSAEPIVVVHDVHQSFGHVEVLKGVSFSVAKGGVVCIIGPSGAGKSSLLRCINGLVPIEKGSIRVANFDVHSLKTDAEKIALRKEVSMVFQQYNLFPHKTALENVMMAPVHVLKRSRVLVEDASGARFYVHEYRGRRMVLPVKRYMLDTGEQVRRIDGKSFEIVATGERLIRVAGD